MKKRAMAFWAVMLLTGSAGAAPGSRRLLLRPKPGVPAALAAAALREIQGAGAGVKEIAGLIRGSVEFQAWVVELPAEEKETPERDRPERLSSALAPGSRAAELSRLFRIEEDVRLKWIEAEAASFQSRPLPSMESVLRGLPAPKANQWAPRESIPWGVRRVNAAAAWPVTQGNGVRVAVIDTGIDVRNPDLDGRVLGGFNALTGSGREEDYQDDHGHGTHVAGTIAATRGNAWGVVGVAPQAVLYSVKVLDKDGMGSLSGVVDGIVWCANNKIQVANLSLGGPVDSETLHEAAQFAEIMGVVLIAAAGNNGAAAGFPASYKEVLSVSAATAEDKLAAFSSRGKVEFIAPGEYVVSLAPGRETANMSGTSMAAPHVSGLAALAVSLGARGLGGPDGVRAALGRAAVPVPGLDAAAAGLGMIDAGRLVK